MIEARGRDIDFVRTIGMFVSERTSAMTAECPPRTCFGAIPIRRSPIEAKAGMLHCNPGDRLRPNGAPAVFAVAIGLMEGFRSGAKIHFSTVAAAMNGRVFHR